MHFSEIYILGKYAHDTCLFVKNSNTETIICRNVFAIIICISQIACIRGKAAKELLKTQNTQKDPDFKVRKNISGWDEANLRLVEQRSREKTSGTP